MKVLLTVISFLLISSIATAVCLKGHPSIAEEYADSQSVFIGKVVSMENVPALCVNIGETPPLC